MDFCDSVQIWQAGLWLSVLMMQLKYSGGAGETQASPSAGEEGGIDGTVLL